MRSLWRYVPHTGCHSEASAVMIRRLRCELFQNTRRKGTFVRFSNYTKYPQWAIASNSLFLIVNSYGVYKSLCINEFERSLTRVDMDTYELRINDTVFHYYHYYYF